MGLYRMECDEQQLAAKWGVGASAASPLRCMPLRAACTQDSPTSLNTSSWRAPLIQDFV